MTTMRLSFDPVFLSDLLRAEAAARGVGAKLQSLVARREDDGLTEVEAVADAAESLGLLEIEDALVEALESLSELELEVVELTNNFGEQPSLRRREVEFRLALAPTALGEMLAVVQPLVEQFRLDPERMVATVAVGLGGSGGCACGDELPEDQPPGPLFLR
jgi:hypothetical protein